MADDRFARFTHQVEQFGAALRQIAPALAAYWRQLHAEGLDAEAATRMTLAVQEQLLRNALEERRP